MSAESKNCLVGTWCEQNETLSSVEYAVAESESGYSVTALDTYDSEPGEVYEVAWDPENAILSFSCYWPSSGRFCKCKLRQLSEDKLDFTYTYTDHEILVRKNA
jgi:hypothetical protein